MITTSSIKIDADPIVAPLSLPDVRLDRVGPALWRTVDRQGRILGHIEVRGEPGARRYRARRFRSASRAFLEIGEFWSVDDAVSALRAR